MINKNSIPILIIFIVVALFFGRLFYPEVKLFITPQLGQSDIIHINLPLKFFLSQSLKQNTLPFIANQVADGFPAYADGRIGTFNIPNLILFKYLEPVTAFNLNLVLSMFLAAVFTFLFLRQMGVKIIPALFSGLSFGLSFYLVLQIPRYNILQTISFLPVLVYLSHRFIADNKRRYLILFAFILAQQIFSGYFQGVFIVSLFIFFYFLYFSDFWPAKQQHGFSIYLRRKFFPFLISFLLGIGLAGIQLLPSIKYYLVSNRTASLKDTEVSRVVSTSFSYPAKHLLTLFDPFWLGNPSKGTYPAVNDFDGSLFWENNAYIGKLAVFLALCSIVFWKKNKYIRFFVLSGGGAFLLMTGKYSPFYFIFSFFPFNVFAVPSRFVIIFVFSLSVLAGLSLNEIIIRSKSKIIYLLTGIFLLVNTYDLYSFGYGYHPVITKAELAKKPPTVEFLSRYPENKVYALDTGSVWNDYYQTKGWQNPSQYLYFYNSLLPLSNVLWSVPTLNPAQYSLTKRNQFLNSLINIYLDPEQPDDFDFSLKLLQQSGVRFILSGKKFDINTTQNKTDLVFTAENQQTGFYIYELMNFLPFARLVSDVKKATTYPDFVSTVSDKNFYPAKTLTAEADLPGFTEAAQNKILNISRYANKVEINTENNNPSYLVIQQQFLNGWEVKVDGKTQPLLAANIDQMAVMAPAGKHRIVFNYLPDGFTWGILITSISVIGLLIAFVFPDTAANRNFRTLSPSRHHRNTPKKSYAKKRN